jgi:manganese transport protein
MINHVERNPMAKILDVLKERFGPAIIVAAVVLGPGSILTSSKVGCEYGYSMLWVLVGAGLLMVGATALSARLGVTLEGTLCDELTRSLGRPLAIFIGVVLFAVVASFQSSNNTAVITSIEPLLEAISGNLSAETMKWLKVAVLVGVNGLVVATLYGLRNLYGSLEKLMKWLMGLMVLGFGVNLLVAQPALLEVFKGLVPSLPEGGGSWLPTLQVDEATGKTNIVDPYWAVQGMIATTFSIAGAFYQSYLVREKGWKRDDLNKGLGDSIFGIAALGLTTMMIMVTAGTVLHGRVDPASLKSASDVAVQLEPLFGRYAALLFVMGIFAGAFSSFLVNASIGGVLLSDGLGLGASLDRAWPKLCTVLALLIGMSVAILATVADFDTVGVIIFAQALTVLGGPILAVTLLYLALSRAYAQKVQAPWWILGLMGAGTLVVCVLAIRTAVSLYYRISMMLS